MRPKKTFHELKKIMLQIQSKVYYSKRNSDQAQKQNIDDETPLHISKKQPDLCTDPKKLDI